MVKSLWLNWMQQLIQQLPKDLEFKVILLLSFSLLEKNLTTEYRIMREEEI